MTANSYGVNLNPSRRLTEPVSVKGMHQSVVEIYKPSTIDANQQLLVTFTYLGLQDAIVPGTVKLAFTIIINRDDPNAKLVQNIQFFCNFTSSDVL